MEDAGETGFQSVQQSGPYRSGDTTAPTATTVAAYPDTKVKNGVTYTFVGWYDNEQFTGNVISFPYAMRANKEFYAKYVAGYNVNYDLDGGSWNIPSTYFKNADSNVYVVGTTPTKTGYDFNGWDRQDDDSHVYVANEKFMMPDNNVTFKAKWTPKEVSYTVNYYWAGTTTSVAESKTVTGKHFGDVINDEVPVEAEGYTAINTPQSLTLGSEANIINFYYYKNVILTANSDEKTYNGNEQNVHGYTCSVSGVVFSRITAVANGTDAAEYASTFTENAVGKIDDSRRYIVESTHTGLLKIKPRSVTVKAASDEKEYDGIVLTNAGWSVEKATETTGLVGTDTIGSVKVTGSQLYPGRSSNVPSEASFTSGKATNYQISYVNGTLEVKDRGTKYVITANAPDGEYTYDGTAKTASGVTYDTLTFGGETYTVEGLSSSRTETDADPAGYETTIVGTAVVKDSAGNDVTNQFRVDTTDTGLLKIKPREVTVTAASDEKEYDGTVLTNAGWSVEKATETTGLVGTDTIGSVKVTGSQLYPGRSSNVPSEASFTSGKATNYQISYVNGTLKVKDRGTKYVITANAPDREYTYDGTAKTASGVTYDKLTFGGKTYTVEGLSSSRTETDADPAGYETTIVGTAVVKDSAGNDVTSQFSVDTTDTGLLKINPREVTVTAASDEKEYDGTVLTNAGWSVEAATETTGLVGTDTIGDVKVTGSQLYPGSSSNVPSEASFTSGKATNYQISYVNGTLKVKDRGTKYVITANAPDREYTYDGTAKTASGVTYDKLTFGGKTYTVEGLSSSRTETDVDPTGNGYVTTIVGTAVVKDSDGQDVTEQFTVNATDTGLLKINPRKVTITAASDKKQYDGTVLVSANWSVEKATENTGLVGGDVIGTVKVTGSQLQPGKSSNVPSDAKFTVGKASNYDIEYVNGSLEITGNSNNNNGGEGGGSSSGGGGSSSGPRDNGSTPSGGPGATTVTIDPDAVPLANLPNEDGAADLLVIDDEDVPLAALPKTGQSGASGLVLFLSSMMLAAFVAVSKKREDDK